MNLNAPHDEGLPIGSSIYELKVIFHTNVGVPVLADDMLY